MSEPCSLTQTCCSGLGRHIEAKLPGQQHAFCSTCWGLTLFWAGPHAGQQFSCLLTCVVEASWQGGRGPAPGPFGEGSASVILQHPEASEEAIAAPGATCPGVSVGNSDLPNESKVEQAGAHSNTSLPAHHLPAWQGVKSARVLRRLPPPVGTQNHTGGISIRRIGLQLPSMVIHHLGQHLPFLPLLGQLLCEWLWPHV